VLLWAGAPGSGIGAVDAGADLMARLHTHRREFGLIHTPSIPHGYLLRGVTGPTSVTQTQPGGSPSSVERVEIIGSSFPFEAAGQTLSPLMPPVSASHVTV